MKTEIKTILMLAKLIIAVQFLILSIVSEMTVVKITELIPAIMFIILAIIDIVKLVRS